MTTHSKTVVTPFGNRVTTRAYKLYLVVLDAPDAAEVTLRTNDLDRARRLVRKVNVTNRRAGNPERAHLYRKHDGAHLCPVTSLACR